MTEFDPTAWFGPDGRLAETLPGFEHRPQQSLMAGRVWDALARSGRHAIEAGTGTGKSIAYLVPAAIWAATARQRVVISTYTRLLQSQLIAKDVPLATRLVDVPIRAAVAYGQENYLCRFRLEQQLARGLFDTRAEADAAGRLFEWADQTEDGVLLGYPGALAPGLLRRVSRESGACRRERCQYRKGCFYQRARRSWEQAGIVITNHSLYFAAITSAADLLPEHGAVIFDEAHRLEDACVRHFGADVGQRSVAALLAQVSGPSRSGLVTSLPARSAVRRDVNAATDRAREAAERFFTETAAALPPESTRTRLREPLPGDEPGSALSQLADALDESLDDLDDELAAAEISGVVHRLRATAGAFAAFTRVDPETSVHWADRTAGGLDLNLAPLNVAGKLRQHVYEREGAVVLTSATLTVAGEFDFFSRRLGLDDFSCCRLDSPFDYERNSLICVPRGLPPPTDRRFNEVAAATLHRLFEHSSGRALVLFTSYDSLHAILDLMPDSRYHYLCQGEMPLPALLEAFQQDTHSVLFATQSFWQGIDVPGEALSCLAICRLPFEVPDDPRLSAIAEQLKAAGEEPFTTYQLPTAVLRFRQGFGRLIRAAADRGVVCVLDRRIVDRPYGRVFLASLPPGIRLSTSLDDVAAFFAGPGR